jgi:benzoylformate decarboxylase
VFVALPINVMEQETENGPAGPGSLYLAPHADPAGLADVADRVLAADHPVIVCGDNVAYEGASDELVRLAEAVGAGVWVEALRQLQPFPTGYANACGRLPMDAAANRKALDGADLVLLIGGPFFDDVWFTEGGHIPHGAGVIQIENSQQQLARNFALDAGLVGGLTPTLGALGERVAAKASAAYKAAAKGRNAALAQRKEKEAAVYDARAQKAWARTPTSMPRVMAELSAAVPDDVIIVDEAITASIDLAYNFEFSAPGDYFGSRGGGIGQGLAGVIGVKVANPDRPVVCISGDGSAMYSIQALWTAAHHNLAIVFVILVNREYRVLKHNADVFRQRFSAPSNRPYPQMDITGPELGFVDLARGMGVPGVRVEAADGIKSAMATALASGGPYVVELIIEGKP